MKRAEIHALAKDYVLLADRLLTKHAHKAASAEVSKLKNLGARLLEELYNWRGSVSAAVEARSEQAAERRLAEPFLFHWRSSDRRQTIKGWDKAARELGFTASTLRVKLSQGKGKFSTTRIDPETMTDDNLTVTRVNYKSGQGRPKHEEPVENS